MESRSLVALSVTLYNIASWFALYFKMNDIALHGEWAKFTDIATSPLTLISYIYLSAPSAPFYPVIIIQLVMLCLTLFVADRIVKYIQNRDKNVS